MLNWLVDDPTLLYMLLAIAAIISFVAWWRTRQGRFALAGGVAVILVGLVWLLGFLIPSAGKKIEHALQEMSAGVQDRDLNRIFAHVSDHFQQGPPTFGSTLDKAGFRHDAESVLRLKHVEKVIVWNVRIEELSRDRRLADVSFYAKPISDWGRDTYYLVRAQFALDEDGQWRLRGFEVFNPFVNTHEAVRIPSP
jgi:hypothetical protein